MPSFCSHLGKDKKEATYALGYNIYWSKWPFCHVTRLTFSPVAGVQYSPPGDPQHLRGSTGAQHIFDATVLSTWMKHDWNKDTLKTTGPLLALEPGLSFSTLNMVWETSLGSTQECCYLYHCSLNVLAVEAISQNKLLWKIRPKLHKILVCVSCQKRRGCPRDPAI